ncbi:nuclear transport factor 2 family protein [Streptomyces sp. NBC_00996]|uniref:nuclear transport factor 2 family protein n=1 Tax=Streptomyces sp. NBC_00996 TaxID=2903710 RepID=UPI00386BB8C5|nr:ester cyclase [Streptomyces sp. NBC_00996]
MTATTTTDDTTTDDTTTDNPTPGTTTPGTTAPGSPLTPATGIALFERWTALWNGDFADPERFLAPNVRIRFGNDPDNADTDTLHGPQALVDFIAAFRASLPGQRYAVEGTPLVDAGQGGVASRWYMTRQDDSRVAVAKSGIDLFQVEEGRIVTVWSVTGLRRFAP